MKESGKNSNDDVMVNFGLVKEIVDGYPSSFINYHHVFFPSSVPSVEQSNNLTLASI